LRKGTGTRLPAGRIRAPQLRGCRMYMKFSDPARMVMQAAESEARRLRHEYVGTEHLLLGVANNESGVARVILLDLGVDPKRIADEAEKILQSGHGLVPEGKLPLTPRARNVVRFAMEEASGLDHKHVGTPHLLLGLLREVEGVGAQILMNLGVRGKTKVPGTFRGAQRGRSSFRDKELRPFLDASVCGSSARRSRRWRFLDEFRICRQIADPSSSTIAGGRHPGLGKGDRAR